MNTRNSEKVILPILLIGLAIILVYANYNFSLNAPGGNDFLARWVGAKAWIVDGINPYSPQVSLEAQELIYGRPARIEEGEDIAHFVYPLPAMVFFAPFGFLPYTLARAVWMTALELGLILLAIVSIRVVRWKPGRFLFIFIILFSILWYHGFRAVIIGQFAIIEALLIVGSLYAIHREADIMAGILLALSIAKPQMAFLIIPFALLWGLSVRRWGFLASFTVTFALLIAGSLLLIPSWILDWLRQLLEYPEYTSLGSPISILTSVLPIGAQWVEIGILILLIAYLLLEWFKAFGKPERWFQWTAALTLAITNLVAFRTATTNYVILLTSIFLILVTWSDRWQGKNEISIFIFLLILLLGIWALFLVTVEGNVEHPLVYLPVPIIAFVGLLWSRWWAIQATKL
jgi:hypothetical protein